MRCSALSLPILSSSPFLLPVASNVAARGVSCRRRPFRRPWLPLARHQFFYASRHNVWLAQHSGVAFCLGRGRPPELDEQPLFCQERSSSNNTGIAFLDRPPPCLYCALFECPCMLDALLLPLYRQLPYGTHNHNCVFWKDTMRHSRFTGSHARGADDAV